MKRAIAIVSVVFGAATAHAAPFPPDDGWFPLLCDGAPMTDRFEDVTDALDDRDVVGDFGAPAGFHAVDDEFLYLRLRLDEDPAPGGVLRPSAWGIELDLDADPTSYELLLVVDGVGVAEVAVDRNRTTTVPNSPADPADLPPIATYPFATNGRSIVASRSSYGGDPDYFLDFAVPWTALVPLGLDRATRTSLWAASSSVDTSLNGDLACHDGRAGAPALDQVISDPTAGDPTVDSDGDGFTDAQEIEAGTDPNDPNSFPASRLEGGGGCAVGGHRTLGLGLVLGWLWRRRRRLT